MNTYEQSTASTLVKNSESKGADVRRSILIHASEFLSDSTSSREMVYI